jgi:hypothetical protein
LFVARAVLDMMLKSPDAEKSKVIRAAFANIKSPLMTVIDILYLCIEAKDFALVNKMVNEDYAVAVKRDNGIYQKIDGVCRKEFNQSIAPVNPMQEMMARMMGGGK